MNFHRQLGPVSIFPIEVPIDGGLFLREWLPLSADFDVLERAFRVDDIVASLDSTAEIDARGVRPWVVAHVEDSRTKARTTGQELWLAVEKGATGPIAGLILEMVHQEHPDEWEIGVWVFPEARGQGVAVRAIGRALEWLSAGGATSVWFQAVDGRSVAIAKSLGAKPVLRPEYLSAPSKRTVSVLRKSIEPRLSGV